MFPSRMGPAACPQARSGKRRVGPAPATSNPLPASFTNLRRDIAPPRFQAMGVPPVFPGRSRGGPDAPPRGSLLRGVAGTLAHRLRPPTPHRAKAAVPEPALDLGASNVGLREAGPTGRANPFQPVRRIGPRQKGAGVR